MIDNLKQTVNPRFTNPTFNNNTYNDIDYSMTFLNKISQNYIRKDKAKYRLERKSFSNKIILNNSPMVEVNKISSYYEVTNVDEFSLGEIIDNYNSFENPKSTTRIKRLEISLRNDNKDKFINKKREQAQMPLVLKEKKKLPELKTNDFKLSNEVCICSKCNYLFESSVEVDDIIKHIINC